MGNSFLRLTSRGADRPTDIFCLNVTQDIFQSSLCLAENENATQVRVAAVVALEHPQCNRRGLVSDRAFCEFGLWNRPAMRTRWLYQTTSHCTVRSCFRSAQPQGDTAVL